MFETSVVRARAVAPRYRLLTLSLAMHSCAVVAVVTATLISVKIPDNAPKQYELPVLMPAITLPPALGTPHPKPAPAVPPQKRAEVTPSTPVAPQVIPDQVQPATTDASTSTSTTTDPNATGEGGEQGVPWGVKGGLPTTDTTPPANVAGPEPIRVTGEVKAPVVITRVMPEYPRVAMVARKSGWVVVECIIDKSGRIRNAKVVGSSFGAFEQPALDAVQQWVFTPGSLHGEPVDVIFDLTVTFTLK